MCTTNEAGSDWMNKIETCLIAGNLPKQSNRAHKIRVQTAYFTLIGDSLYRRSFGDPYLRCLNNVEAQYVLAELHEGICGNHIGGTNTHHAHSQGYYWRTMKQDVVN